MHHINRRQGLRSFFQHAPHSLPANCAKAGLLARGPFEFDDRPALVALRRLGTCQCRHSCFGIGVVLLGPARTRNVEHGEFQAALQVRRTSPPQGRSTDAEHFHDLCLWHTPIQTGQHMCSINFSRLMNALASNRICGHPLGSCQMKFGLPHGYTPLSQVAMIEVYSCSVTYVSLY